MTTLVDRQVDAILAERDAGDELLMLAGVFAGLAWLLYVAWLWWWA